MPKFLEIDATPSGDFQIYETTKKQHKAIL